MRTRIVTLVVASLLGVVGPVLAEEPHLVLLPVEGDTSIPSLADELEASFRAQGRMVIRSRLGLEDLMLAVGCKSISIGCLRDIGQSVKTSALIISRARKVKEGVELTLRWFDVKTGADVGQLVRLLPLDSVAREKILSESVTVLVGGPGPSSREQLGSLAIASTVPYVEIFLDGQARGTAPLEFRDLRPGTYTVTARREGYVSWQEKASVKANQTTHVHVEMALAPRETPGYFQSIQPATWAVAAGGLVFLAIGSGFAAHLKAEQDHLDATRDAKAVTLDDIHQMQDYKKGGERDALVANILFGMGGAALVAAVVFSYLDYRRARTESASTAPTVSVGPGSFSLRLGF